MQCSFLLTVLASSLISPLSLHDALPICALAIEPRLLLLDEVLAGLNPSEVRDMLPVIRAIANRGVTIVMIEHIMQAVMSLADRKSTRLNSSHPSISYAVFCLKKKSRMVL